MQPQEKMKTKKKASARNKNDVYNENSPSWPNLPQRLIKHLQKHSSLMPTINFGCVTKSWRSHTNKRHCNINPRQPEPSNYLLSISDREYNRKYINPQSCSMSFPREYHYHCWYGKKWGPTQFPWQHFWGCCYGHLVVRGVARASELYVVNPIFPNSYGKRVPELEHYVPFKCAAIWSSPSDSYSNKSCAMMVVTGISSPAFMFYWLRGKPAADSNEWIKKDCTFVDPHEEHFQNRKYDDHRQPFMRFTNAIGVNGKFYALSSQGTLVVIEDVVDFSDEGRRRFEITGFGKARAIPSVLCKGFRECLIESKGEVVLVFLVFGKEDRVVDDVEVYKLCFDDLSWIKMKSLDEKTLFVGSDCCIVVCAENVGCKADCVYFTQQREGGIDGWLEYDMKVGRITPAWTHATRSKTTKYLEWDEPIHEDNDPDLAKNKKIIGCPPKHYY